jgi:phospho-N-acetylmuramoyl-pentapeptide-transferase
MLYHLFTHLREIYDLPGAGLFSFVSFRAGMSLMTSLVVGILLGKRIIERLQLKQVGEIVRDLGLEGQMNKQGTPTMGGFSQPSCCRPSCSPTSPTCTPNS